MRFAPLTIALVVLAAQQAAWSQDLPSLASQPESYSAFPNSPLDLGQPAARGTDVETDALRQQLSLLEAQQRETQLALDQLRQQLGYDRANQKATVIQDPAAMIVPPDADTGQAFPNCAECSPEPTLIERLGTRYNNGFVLVESPDPQRVPFQLSLNVFNQFRFLNQNLDTTFTDHLGNVRPVDARNDINVNRNLYYFGGYAFDPNLIFNVIIWSSNSVATVIQGGYIGYKFSDSLTLYGGYWGIPGSRSNTRDFMWLQGVERSMADSFFRPGFTQGIWLEGNPAPQLYYVAYVGNSMNTLNINTAKIDKNFVYSTSAWWEPLGDYGPPGAPRMAFSDLESHETAAVRLGTSFSFAREDRFSNPAINPENVAIYNSDGVLFFETGSLAPGATVLYADCYISSFDFGVKKRGLAFNSQYFFRWLNDFVTDGAVPLSQTYDNGFEASLGYFVVPQTFEVYGRTSAVFGEFKNSSEYALGTNWHPWHNRGFRIITELNKVEDSPTASIQTIYNAGMNGWNFVIQTQLYF